MTKKVVHIITSTATGGAENMLFNLIKGSSHVSAHRAVISLMPMGSVAEKICDMGVEVLSLNMKSLRGSFSLYHLAKLLRSLKPDLVHTWMYHANFFGSLAAVFAGRPPVLWSLHHSDLSFRFNKKKTMLLADLCSPISRTPLVRKIVNCSQSAMDAHSNIGYCASKMSLIPNGFDLDVFAPDSSASSRLRKSVGLEPDTLVVSMVGRWDPQKDLDSFIKAIAVTGHKLPVSRYIICGKGLDENNTKLVSMIQRAGISEKVLLLGFRDDMPLIMAGSDLVVMPSRSEAFPMVLGEAMACGTVCIVTDVGDAALLLGGLGWTVPPNNPKALAQAIEFVLIFLGRTEREKLGVTLRNRIAQNFSLSQVVDMYENIYAQL